MLFFFFQAEDGIRDYKVTGVQTCALPILNTGILAPAGVSKISSAPSLRPIQLRCSVRVESDQSSWSRFSRSRSAYRVILKNHCSRNRCSTFVITRYAERDRKSTRLNSSHLVISYAVF